MVLLNEIMFPLSLSSLFSVCNVSQNGSRLVQLDDDITELVDRAQQAASLADSSASLALSLVCILKSCVLVLGSPQQQVNPNILDVSLFPPSHMTCYAGSGADGICALPEYNLGYTLPFGPLETGGLKFPPLAASGDEHVSHVFRICEKVSGVSKIEDQLNNDFSKQS